MPHPISSFNKIKAAQALIKLKTDQIDSLPENYLKVLDKVPQIKQGRGLIRSPSVTNIQNLLEDSHNEK